MQQAQSVEKKIFQIISVPYGYQKDQNTISFTGSDDEETSKKFLEVLNDSEISSKLKKPNAISIKVQNGSQSCTQFSQIYPVILVPSIYFIDSQSGVNIETTGGAVDKEKLIESIDKALEGHEKNATTPVGVADSIASPRNERVEQARQVLQTEVKKKHYENLCYAITKSDERG